MKIFKTDNFISERIKVQPITNAELEKAQKDLENVKNPFKLTKEDLVGTKLENYPMGVVVRMLEEQEKQGNKARIGTARRDANDGGFTWRKTVDGWQFWEDVITGKMFDVFFEKYPEYRKYNLD